MQQPLAVRAAPGGDLHVHDGDDGLRGGDQLLEAGGVVGLAGYLEAGLGQQPWRYIRNSGWYVPSVCVSNPSGASELIGETYAAAGMRYGAELFISIEGKTTPGAGLVQLKEIEFSLP